MGGQEKCVLANEAENYVSKNCSDDLICAAVYNCEIESCEYIDGECAVGGRG